MMVARGKRLADVAVLKDSSASGAGRPRKLRHRSRDRKGACFHGQILLHRQLHRRTRRAADSQDHRLIAGVHALRNIHIHLIQSDEARRQPAKRYVARNSTNGDGGKATVICPLAAVPSTGGE